MWDYASKDFWELNMSLRIHLPEKTAISGGPPPRLAYTTLIISAHKITRILFPCNNGTNPKWGAAHV